jgi:hypothetical protein
MSNPEHFQKYLGNAKYYVDFLVFWQSEIEKKGWTNVLNEYVFAGDEKADALLTRLFAGRMLPLLLQVVLIGKKACTIQLSIWASESNFSNRPS